MIKKMKTNNIIILVVSVLVVTICVGFAFWYASGREYGLYNKQNSEEVQSINATLDSTLSSPTTDANSDSGNTSSSLITVDSDQKLPDNLKTELIVKKAYEIKEFLAVDGFNGLQDVSINRVVQYAFCYLYSDGKCLVDYNTANMVYRSATRQQIEGKIVELFGSCTIDVTKSELYNSGSKSFEMWQPNYCQAVYSTAKVTLSGDVYIVTADYYADASKKNKTFTSKINVNNKDGNYIITSIA